MPFRDGAIKLFGSDLFSSLFFLFPFIPEGDLQGGVVIIIPLPYCQAHWPTFMRLPSHSELKFLVVNAARTAGCRFFKSLRDVLLHYSALGNRAEVAEHLTRRPLKGVMVGGSYLSDRGCTCTGIPCANIGF